MRTLSLSAFLPLLLLAACQAEIGSSASSEDLVDHQPPRDEGATGPSPFDQSEYVVASSGEAFLAAWAERLPSGKTIVRAGRIDAQGKVIDDRSLDLPSVGDGNDLQPGVAFNGSDYLVTWIHRPDTNDSSGALVVGARVSLDGKLLDEKPIPIGSKRPNTVTSRGASPPVVTANGTSWIVAWSDDQGLYVGTIDKDGRGLGGASGVRVTGDRAIQDPHLAIATAGTTTFLMWNELRGLDVHDLYGLRLGQTAEPIDAAPVPIEVGGADKLYPSIASNGGGFLVSWVTADGDGVAKDAHAELLGVDGVPDGEVIHRVAGGEILNGSWSKSGVPSAAWDGEAWVLASKYSLHRLDTSRKLTTMAIAPFLDFADEPVAVASSVGGKVLVMGREATRSSFYQGGAPVFGVLYGRGGDYGTFSAGGVSAPEIPNDPSMGMAHIRPARGPSTMRDLVSARNGDEELLVWTEYRRSWNQSDIRAALRKADGTLEKSFTLFDGGFGYDGARAGEKPVVQFDGRDYVVTFTERYSSHDGDMFLSLTKRTRVPKDGKLGPTKYFESVH